MKTDHIVLIGFKHVGKSVVGKKLSETLQMPFVDLDKEIEYDYEQATGCRRSCREIMEIEKEPYFRELESFSLVRVLKGKKAIISVGGGTPLLASNQALLKDCRVIHITASRGIVFERILVTGRPEFFNPDQDLLTSFNQLWDEREAIYEKLRDLLIENDGTVFDAVVQIIKKMKEIPS